MMLKIKKEEAKTRKELIFKENMFKIEKIK